ncbi:MAG: hypothetical protein AAGF58_09825 [Pseudomonadota bacterium]
MNTKSAVAHTLHHKFDVTALREDSRSAARKLVDYLSGERSGLVLTKFLDPCLQHIQTFDQSDAPAFFEVQLRSLFEYWVTLPKTDGVADTTKVDPHLIEPALGYVMLVDVEDSDGREMDFRYSLYGSKIARTSGFDLTGKCVSELEATINVLRYFYAVYYAACEIRQPIYTTHTAPVNSAVDTWHRLVLPLGEKGQVRRLLVGNIPVRDGKVV